MDLFIGTDTVPRVRPLANSSRGDQGRSPSAGNGCLADRYASHLSINWPTIRNRGEWRLSPRARSLLARVIGVAILASLAFPTLALASSGSIRPATARLVPRIVGGTPAPAGTFPWLAFILYNVSPAGFSNCSGTVVSSNVVLTAGHCAEDPTTGSLNPPGGYAVITGSHDWTDTNARQVSGVSQVIVYPGYNPKTGQGDAALLVLRTPTTAPPIALATASDLGLLAPGTLGTISGWGQTIGGDPNSTPTALQWATTVVQSPAYCNQEIPALDPYTQVCAINAPSLDTSTCFGDSGGPLLANDLQGQNGNPIEIGISVEVLNNCDTTLPDIYTRVDVISPWANGWIAAVKPPPPTPTSTPSPSPKTPVAGLYRGQTNQRLPIAARVGSSDSITAVDFRITLRCKVHGHRLSYGVTPVTQRKQPWPLFDSGALGFSQYFSGSAGVRYHLVGTFNTTGTVSGTLHAVSHTHRYGTCDSGQLRWHATT
jgi:secreted trypsin-like serine protease